MTEEEKVAVKIGKLLSDFTLDLRMVAFYLVRVTPLAIMNRLLEVMKYTTLEYSKAKAELKYRKDKHDGNTLF